MVQRDVFIAFSFMGLSVFSFPQQPSTSKPSLQDFNELLKKASMTFSLPADFSEVPVIDNNDVNYHYAVALKKVKLEIRYVVRTLSQDIKDYEENNRKGLNPNSFYEALLLTMCLNISDGKQCTPSAFSPDDVKSEFGADAGLTAFVQLNSIFGRGYKLCLINVIHLQNKADAFIFFLFDDFRSVQPYCFRDDVFHALKFR
ncbi:MAG: hypothetical protein AABZ02_06115 [Bacteroidota bacterium]